MDENLAAKLNRRLRYFAETKNVVVNRKAEKHKDRLWGSVVLHTPHVVEIYECSSRLESHILYTLAHELGHLMDLWRHGFLDVEIDIIKKASKDLASLGEYEEKIFYQIEKRAWDEGRLLLKTYGLEDFSDYEIRAATNLNGIKNRFKNLKGELTMQRPLFRHLVNKVRKEAERQKQNQSIVSVSPSKFLRESIKIGDKTFRVARGELMLDWPKIAREAGLVDDCTGKNLWTIPGHGYFDAHPEAEQRRAEARRKSMSYNKRQRLEEKLSKEKSELREALNLNEGSFRAGLVRAKNKKIRELKKELGK